VAQSLEDQLKDMKTWNDSPQVDKSQKEMRDAGCAMRDVGCGMRDAG
jgi:hypothetical protein